MKNLTTSALSVVIGMLLMMVMGLLGIYRGLIQDATLLIERIGADLRVFQLHTRGRFRMCFPEIEFDSIFVCHRKRPGGA